MSSSLCLLNSTIQHHFNKYSPSHPELVTKLLQSFYVDDLVCGGNSEEEAYEHYLFAKEALSHASFNLRKFVTSSHVLRETMLREVSPEQNRYSHVSDATYVDDTLSPDQPTLPEEHKVLGVCWNSQSDQLIFDLSTIAKSALPLVPTKRKEISLIGHFYNSLGFLSPITIRFKVLIQELCKTQVNWDEPLEGNVLKMWKELTTDLEKSKPVAIDRYYFSTRDDAVQYQLFGFCNASTITYAAVIYVVEIGSTGKRSSFVVSKTRVTPLKTQTIPRLELLSAPLLARLMKTVMDSLKEQLTLQLPRCFTDSQIGLYWITGTEKDWKPLVQNRVTEIRRLVPAEC